MTVAAKRDPIQANWTRPLQGCSPEHFEILARLNPKMQQCMPFSHVNRPACAGRWRSWRGILR